MPFVVIYITHPNLKTAKKIVAVLMKKRLIACGNIFPIDSSYWWEGKIEHDREVVSIVKTTKQNWKKVEAAVIKLHPYQTPCVMKFDVSANSGYEAWIKHEVK